MKKALSLLLALVMCLSLCACGGRNATSSETEASSETEVSSTPQKCDHVYSNGYCSICKEMDPSCQELTAENYEDYLGITYKMANVDGSTGGSNGFVAFPYLYLTATPTSSRIMFYDVEIEIEFTVKQCLYPSKEYEECTVTAKIPVALFGEGDAKVRLDRESNDPVLLKASYISEYKITSINGCVSVQ
ncbi:MAG: hypothetical protein IJV82_02385 [Oscillospiraceae bacterium]|nr:hypothetical protein [Oscillospiraceae bacterium]